MVIHKNINLLNQTHFDSSSLGKLIFWATNVGRWVVVLTEFIVICAFLSRFYFDTKLANLFDETRQKKAMVNSSFTFEEQYRLAQEKLKLVKIITAPSVIPSKTVIAISAKLPLDTTITKLSIDQSSVSIDGYSFSEEGLGQFVKGLTEIPGIDKVSVGKLVSGTDGSPNIGFSITAKINITT